MKVKVAFTIDQEVMEEIDNLRDLACRSAFINHVLKLGLKAYEGKTKSKRKDSQCPNQTTPNDANMKAQSNAKS